MKCELQIKAKIIDVLGEEMFNYFIENPEKAISFSWLFSFSIAEFDNANGINTVISSRLLKIREELGEELCYWCSTNYKALNNLINMLNSYVNTYAVAQKVKENLYQLFKAIDSNNNDAKIAPLVLVLEAKDGTSGLLKLFKRANIIYVRDLSRVLSLTIDEKDNVQLIRFAKWLGEDKKTILRNDLLNLSHNDREKEIISKRANGATLEETSSDHEISLERVRQIEKKFLERFNSYISRQMPHYILYAFGKSICYLSIDELNKVLGDLASIFTYCLKASNCITAHWCNQLNGFIIGDVKWYEQLSECQKGLPDILDSESVDKMIGDIINNLALPLAFDDTKRIILLSYRLSGKVYLKKRVSLSQMYFAVLKKYYPDGIKLYDDTELIRFRNYVHELFGDVHLPENNRAIEVRLFDLTVLCDRGKRILPCGIKISTELLSKIHDVIMAIDRDEIRYISLFEIFKDELLETSNITNKYFLQGVLKQMYSNDLNFTRYSCKKLLKISRGNSNKIIPLINHL